MTELQIVWFKRDLRVSDHRALSGAASHGPVLPLYVAEPALWAEADASGRQWAFIAECLDELRRDLADLGQPLVIRIGDIVAALEAFRRSHGVAALWSHQETGNLWTFRRDQQVAAWAREHGIPWHEPRQGGTVRKLGSRDGWARRWDRFMAEPITETPRLAPLADIVPGPIPEPTDLGITQDLCLERQAGGRAFAMRTLESFLQERGEPYRRAMSAPASGARHCSRLSPHLAWGTLSMREVAQATWSRMRELKHGALPTGGWRPSLVSFTGRLHWRDHFMQKLEDEPDLEVRDLHPAYEGLRPEVADRDRLRAWSAGETGLPFVDACMRCLNATGWMNFRMRAMLMAVASYHLWLPWRASGEHLARKFTDYEPGIHWPQTQMQSGTTGINTVRIYNPVKQGFDQDPDGIFVRQWLPELAPVPDKFVQEPWKWEEAGQFLGNAYPAPIVDHLLAAKAARDKVWAVRRGSTFRDGANRIQEKHGSRKSGIPHTGTRRPVKKDDKQLRMALGGDQDP
ncbi:MAG: FAD-binding domain-containing protein [Geminicoccaceae bacterium]